MRKTIEKTKNKEPEHITPNETRKLYQRAFEIINRRLFNSELPYILIDFAVDEDEESNETRAYFAYYDEEDNHSPEIILDLHGLPEIGISTDTINDLFHEMAHYYCFLHGIQDTDGEDLEYHNLSFKKVIEDHGGQCKYLDDIIGYSDTSLSEQTLNEIFYEI